MHPIDENRAYIGPIGVVAALTGNIIGSGIFTSPSSIIQDTTSIGLALSVWIFTGVVSMTGAMSYAELAATIRISGGDSNYANFINWKYVAYFFAITNVFVLYPTVVSIQALTFAEYFCHAAGITFTAERSYQWSTVGIAIGLISALLILNMLLTAPHILYFNIFMSTLKIGLLIAMVVIAFVKGKTSNLRSPFDNSTLNPDMIIGSFYNAWFAFDGYDLVSVGAEEILNPAKNLPLVVLITMCIVILMYVLINLAYAMVLGTKVMIKSKNIVFTFATVALPRQSYLMSIVVCICLIGAVNGTLFEGSRISHALARDQILPNWLSCWHVRMRTPRSALVFCVLLTIAFLLFITFDSLIELSNVGYVAQWIQRLFSAALLLLIRIARLQVPSEVYQMNIMFPCLYFVCLFAMILSTVAADWTFSWFTLITLLATFFVYYVLIWSNGLRQISLYNRVYKQTAVIGTRLSETIFRCKTESEKGSSSTCKPPTLFVEPKRHIK